jgi:Mg-chelatase subunit ChlD
MQSTLLIINTLNTYGLVFGFFLALFQVQISFAQSFSIEPKRLDFGTTEKAGSVKTRVVIKNKSSKTLILLKADAPKNFIVRAGRKIIPANDTTQLIVEYHPSSAGKFSGEIQFFHNQGNNAETLKVSGEIKKLLADELSNCVDFSPKNGAGNPAAIPTLTNHIAYFVDSKTGNPIKEGSILYVSQSGREKMERTTTTGMLQTQIPIGPYALVVTSPGYETLMTEQYIKFNGGSQSFVLTPSKDQPKETAKVEEQAAPKPTSKEPELFDNSFKPNNIVFLIDISGSMKEPEKLPLLKKSIATLLKPIRETDKITIITYAEEVKTIVPTSNGSQKTSILQQLDSLKAAGVTAGSAGIKKAYELAESAFVTDGNNQVILATDGVFRVSAKDKKMIEKFAASTDKKIILSVTGFGNQEDALNMLKGLSTLGNGSFIHIRNERESVNALLEEIKGRSKR